MIGNFWSWLKSWFVRKPSSPLPDARRSAKLPRRHLGIEWLENRELP